MKVAPFNLAQEIRNAYDWRNGEELNRLLEKVAELQAFKQAAEALDAARQVAGAPGLFTQHHPV